MITLYCDGACSNNNVRGKQRIASWGVFSSKPLGPRRITHFNGIAERSTATSNNVAEHVAVMNALRICCAYPSESFMILSDSQLAINQIANGWKASRRKPYYRWLVESRKLLSIVGPRVSFRWIPREENVEADRLANEAAGLSQRPPQSSLEYPIQANLD